MPARHATCTACTLLSRTLFYTTALHALLLTPGATVTAVRQVLVRGDILLGGLFPVHEAGLNGSECGLLKAAQGVQRLQAMLFALEAVNADNTVLPGIVLGAQILDTCSVDSHALEQTLVFIKTMMSSGDGIICMDGSRPTYSEQPVAAVIGAASSQVSVMVASMLQLFKVPQVSYSSTGAELSEKPRFEYFSRVVPPDNLQATAMAHLVSALGWTYVHAVAVTGSYGERGMDSFRAAATESGVCIDGDVHKISRRWSDKHYRELILRMRSTRKARGVVMFVDEDHLRRILAKLDQMIQEDPTLDNYFWFIASDSWGIKQSVVSGYEMVASGAITIAPDLRTVPGFNMYFKGLGPSNTFLREYWDSLNCTNKHENFGECFLDFGITFQQEAYVPSVVDAVNVVAMALHRYVKSSCGKLPFDKCNVSRIGFEGSRLQEYYRNVSLKPGSPPLIDANGDGIGKYSIYQLNDQGRYTKVGKWIAGKEFYLDVERVRSGLKKWAATLPLSVCSTECDRGYYRAYQDQTCCWTCIPCDITTSIVLNETSCIQCPLGEVPNANLDACKPIPPTTLEYNSPWVVLPAAFSTLGIAATVFVVSVFIRYSATPVVMASGRELCYFMLTGISLCYMVTFVLVSKPTVGICAASRVLIGLSMSAIYAAILTKTNRLARVFSPQSAARPGCIVPRAQVGICAAIVAVQLVGSVLWLILDPPGTAVQFPTRTDAVLTCKATAAHLLISLMYNMVLIIACTLYAFKTRKIPENFNETRLIGFTMYSTSILWLSFGPIYFATQNNFKIQVTSLCMCISLSGTVALCCFFAPKVYIVLWQPYKNVRTRQSAVGRLVNQQMRFISQIATSAAPESSPICTSATEYTSNPHATTPSVDPEEISSASTQPLQHSRSPATVRTLLNLSSDGNTLTETTPFIEPSISPPLIPYSFNDVVKDTLAQQNQVEMILREIVASNDVTFL
uniref:Metabotropic glutamate receptor 7 n=1 Tax=Ascaris suum TaxID=6253 RepID=F1KST2_ASCSU